LMAEKGKVIRTKIEDVRETGRGAIGVYLMDLEDDDRVVTVAKIAAEDAKDAHEQAAAKKAEEAEQKEREGSGRRKTAVIPAQGSGSKAPAVTGEAAPKAEGTPDSVKEMLRRAEEEQKQKEEGG